MARILIVDDDEMLRSFIVAALEHGGHDVRAACDGKDGLAQIEREPTDVVVTDLVMPGKDGIETIIAISKGFPHIPVIAMSGMSTHSPVYLSLAKHLGARRILAKPFAIDALLDAVDESLRRQGA